jgi:hypothetical protein
VCDQIRRYKEYLTVPANSGAVVDSFVRVAKNLVCLRKMGLGRRLSALIEEVAADRRELVLGGGPDVRLVIFGYTGPQGDHERWQCHLQRLRNNIAVVRTWGEATDVRLCEQV